MNLEKIADVRRQIALAPDISSDMTDWIWVPYDTLMEDDDMQWTADQEWSCGTTACIAGHAYIMENLGKKINPDNADVIEQEALRILGLNILQGNSLFLHDQWPEKYQVDRLEGSDKDAMIALLDDILSGKLTLTETGEWNEA